MPPRGVKQGTKRARQYEHIKQSQRERGRARIAPRRSPPARSTRSARAQASPRTRSRSSVKDMSSSRRGGQRSGTNRPKGRTREQLYNEARKFKIDGRSKMSKAQLQRAVDARK